MRVRSSPEGDKPVGMVSGHFNHCQNCGHQPLVSIMDLVIIRRVIP